MVDYITQTIQNIGDWVYAWDVVNELIADGRDAEPVYKDTIFMKIDNFICKAFQAARKANP